MLIRLALHPLVGGDLLLTLDADGRATTSARLPAPAAEALRPAVGPPTPVVIPGRDRELRDAEAQWARHAARALFSDLSIARRFAEVLGEAAGRGTPATLLIDAGQAAALCPWELLSQAPDAASLEPAGRACIARLVSAASPPPAPPQTTLRVLTWAPESADPDVAALINAQSARLRGWATHVLLSSTLDELPAARTDTADVLHLVCHGQRDLDRLSLMLGPTEGATADDTASALGPLLRQSSLVLLDVCHGSMDRTGAYGGLAQRLVEAGAPASCGTWTEVDVEAAQAFGDGLLRALREGASVAAAAASGRRAVAALGIAHPSARWHNHRLWVSSGAHAAVPLLTRKQWAPPGIPSGPTALSSLWRVLKREAEAAGYLGIEPLIEALLSTASFPGGAPSVVRGLVPVRHRSRATLERLGLASRPSLQLVVTPRWAKLMSRIPAEASSTRQVAALVSAVLDVYAPFPILGPSDTAVHSRGALLLEVVGGPEDGRRVCLEPGEQLARWHRDLDPERAVGLYQGPGPFDRGISRRGCLQLDERGRLVAMHSRVRIARRLHAPTVSKEGTLQSLKPTCELFVLEPDDPFSPDPGDELWLSVASAPSSSESAPTTCLRVIASDADGNPAPSALGAS